MDKYNVLISILDKDKNEVIISCNAVMIEKDCNNFLKSQLNFINKLKLYTNLSVEISFNKV